MKLQNYVFSVIKYEKLKQALNFVENTKQRYKTFA